MKNPTAKQIKAAEGVILEGKPFKRAALDAGYAESVANRGAKSYAESKGSFQKAFILAAQKAEMNAETLKAVSKHRLVNDIVTGKDSGVTRQVEILARFKEHDWLVRNTDVQIGVFASIAGEDPKASAEVDEISSALPDPDKP